MKQWFRTYGFLLIGMFFLAGCQQDNQWYATKITPDPDWQHGALENGMKYHLYQKDDEPVELRFIVRAGSAQETAQQQGYAHFLEHMAFKGSKNFAQQDVWQFFERLGLSAGADLNAYTSYNKTWYQLTLPDSTEVTTAFTWFRDVADGMLLKPEKVEAERGAVMGEYRLRLPQERNIYSQMDERLRADSPAYHEILGTKESIQSVTPAGLREYYQRWYFPANTELVVVGDFDKAVIETQIAQHFASWQGKPQPLASHEPIVLPTLKQQALVAPQGGDSALILLQPLGESKRLTYGDQYRYLEIGLLNSLIQARLMDRSIALATNTSYIEAYDSTFEGQQLVTLAVGFKEGHRAEVQAFFAKELASLRDYGVGEVELAAALASYKSNLKNHAMNWQVTDSWVITEAMFASLFEPRVLMSEAEHKAVLERFVAEMDQSRVNQSLQQQLEQLAPYYFIAYANTDQTQQLAQDVQDVTQLLAKPGQALMMAKTVAVFSSPAQKGEIVTQQQVDDTTWQWQLGNGVEVWLKQMPDIKNNAYMNWAVKGGRAQLDPALYPASELAFDALYRSGFAGLDVTAIEKVFAANNTLLTPYLSDFDNGLSIATQYDDLPFAMSALHHVLTEGKVDPAQLKQVKKQYVEGRSEFETSPFGQVLTKVNDSQVLRGTFYKIWPSSTFTEITSDDVQQVYQRLFQQKHHNRLVIAGDFQPEDITPLLRQYVANIPLAENKQELLPQVELNKTSQVLELPVSNEKSVGYLMIMTNPIQTQSPMTAVDVMAQDMLSRIVNQRAHQLLRGKYSLSYAPEVITEIPDSGLHSTVIVSMNLDQKDLAKSKKAVAELLKGIQQDGITSQERDTAAKQLAVALKPMAKNGAETVRFMGRYLLHGYSVDAVKDPQPYIDQVTTELLNKQVKQFMGKQSYTIEATILPKAS
ncbi:M16 family metallopeptidase [Photobacterium sanguinicancri]|uniref:M16 family metallopeptidase n=1 Tax=Photobacterium sanguinicancri TaxID=875932 RepID=UPI0026E368CA|nr:M16 family metallopeptidase [Photobacterium sanguinicancri]MDO6497488.1 insulinase family protein [Photobacterium sanguinicancri]